MIKTYVKTALRQGFKNKTTSLINLAGLSVGMAAAIFIFIWVQNELSQNNYHNRKEDIFRITNAIAIGPDESWIWENSPLLMAETATKEIPEIEKASRIVINEWGGPVMNIDNRLFSEKTSAYVDKNWFDIFHYDFVQGSAGAFSQDRFGIVLTRSKAKKYFGSENAVGKIIQLDTVNYTVRAIVEDNPSNSSFRFDIMMPVESRLSDPNVYKNDKNWNNFGYITFIQLKPHASQVAVTKKLNDIYKSKRENNSSTASITPLKDIYFQSELQSSSMPRGNKTTTYIFAILGILLLSTACINYINLTTAKASMRAKEIGVRKITGAGKAQLFFQFIMESLTICFFSLLVALMLMHVTLPWFNDLTGQNFSSPITSVSVWKVMGIALLFTTLMNGVYPALLLSSFHPLNVFRGISVLKVKDGFVRRGLVVFQFSLSILLITGTIVISKQLNYIQKTNPGYNVSQVLGMQIPWKGKFSFRSEERKHLITSMKRELEVQSSISEVSIGGSEIVNVTSASSGNADWDGRDSAFNPTIAHLSVDTGFQKLFKLELVQGKWFTGEKTDEHNFILNETAAREFNFQEPVIGARFTWGGDTGKVIAVVKDFHYKNLHEKIGPILLSNNKGSDSYIFLRTSAGNIPAAIAAANTVWSKFITDQPFNYHFLDDSFNTLYQSDLKTSKLIFIFSVLAIIISALGLFGLATFTAERRTKEIGIRKVLGASVLQISRLLSTEFLILVSIAILIATPIAGWLMNKWLQGFAYRISLTANIFIAAGGLALLIAFVSVSVRAFHAANTNPVKSLRTE
ncbi:ABC transporter permease [Pollutibacter soli]|uniref:ABC transporter permease n=1 Tax=Pollutibacter soli TaxID=3034157 RepID=UPI0030139BA0